MKTECEYAKADATCIAPTFKIGDRVLINSAEWYGNLLAVVTMVPVDGGGLYQLSIVGHDEAAYSIGANMRLVQEACESGNGAWIPCGIACVCSHFSDRHQRVIVKFACEPIGDTGGPAWHRCYCLTCGRRWKLTKKDLQSVGVMLEHKLASNYFGTADLEERRNDNGEINYVLHNNRLAAICDAHTGAQGGAILRYTDNGTYSGDEYVPWADLKISTLTPSGQSKTMNYEDIDSALSDWHQRKFGKKSVDLQRSCVKLLEEAGELAKAILKGDVENAREECADVAIITAHICRGLGSKLFDQMIAKFHVLEKRLESGVKEKK